MDKGLRLKCLGSLEVFINNQPVTDFISNKVPALLCFLALEPGAHSRNELAGLLWSEVSDEHAKRSLRMAISDLRKKFDPYLEITRQSVIFQHSSSHWVDAVVFQQGTQSQLAHSQSSFQPEPLQELVKIYQGDLLQGFYVEEAPLFEEWLLKKREVLRADAVKLLDYLAQTHLARGEHVLGIPLAQRLLDMEPWREETHRQLMTMYYRSDQRSAALAQYERCREILATELNTEPVTATRELYERIRDARSGLVHNLPPAATPFVGREREMGEILALIENPECRMITLAGPGGIGKSRLCAEIAQSLSTRFLDGIYFVPLAPVGSVEMIPYAIASVLGFRLSGRKSPLEQLMGLLEHKEMLVILDNFEHLLDGANQLVEIIQRTHHLKILVTSRAVLNLSWEWVVQLRGLEMIEDAGNDIATSPAVELFSVCMRKSAGREIGRDEVDHIRQICQLLDGIPLGIELTAALTAHSPVAAIAAEITDNLNAVESRMMDSRAEHRSLNVVFEQSWRALDSTEQDLMAALSIFRGGFEEAAIEEIMESTGEYGALLVNLVGKSLVDVAPSNGAPPTIRYVLLEPIRQFCGHKLGDGNQAEVLTQRYLEYYLAQAKRAFAELIGPEQINWLKRLDEDRANFREALQIGLDRVLDRGVELVSALGRFWWLHGDMIEGHRWAERYLERADLDVEQRARLKLSFAEFSERIGNYEDSQATARETLKYFKNVDVQSGIFRSLFCLANVATQRSEFEQAERFAHEALQVAEALGQNGLREPILAILGRIAFRQSRFEACFKLNEEALGLAREIGHTAAVATGLSNLGIARNSQGDFKAAVSYQQESLKIYHELGDRYGESVSMGNLGLYLMNQGNYTEAKPIVESTLALKREVGDKWGISWAMSNLAIIAIEQDEPERAESLLKSALTIDREMGEQNREAIELGNLGNVAMLRDDLQTAKAYYHQSLKIREEIGHQKGIGKSQLCLGHVAVLEGELDQAQAFYSASIKLNNDIGDEQNLALALAGMAGAFCQLGHYAKSAQLFGFMLADLDRRSGKLAGIDLRIFDMHLERLLEGLSDFDEQMAIGRALSRDEAVGLALKTAHE